ncbi:hypothetical protein F5Y16DRAFT_392373 [Xylariaceae sp. FL0255]|nr:hypothetical protein F5Y16DRAFT_392373 [Xylariaceae sp. FL0255]
MVPVSPSIPEPHWLAELASGQLEQPLVTKTLGFAVRHKKMEFYIHPDLVSRLSAPLDDLVKNATESSLEGCVILEDVDEDVLSRFAQFVYTGTYVGWAPAGDDNRTGCSEGAAENMPAVLKKRPVIDKPQIGLFGRCVPSTDSQENYKQNAAVLPYSLVSYVTASTKQIIDLTLVVVHSPECKQNQSTSQISSKRKFDAMTCDCDGAPQSKKKQDFILAFVEKQGGLTGARSFATGPTISNPLLTSFENVLIGHAKVWVFAVRYAITSLSDHAYSRLVHELARWTIFASTFVSEFRRLVHFIYDNCRIGGSQLRLLVAQFATCVVDDVSGLEGWSGLLNEVPNFAEDLMNQMMGRFG